MTFCIGSVEVLSTTLLERDTSITICEEELTLRLPLIEVLVSAEEPVTERSLLKVAAPVTSSVLANAAAPLASIVPAMFVLPVDALTVNLSVATSKFPSILPVAPTLSHPVKDELPPTSISSKSFKNRVVPVTVPRCRLSAIL